MNSENYEKECYKFLQKNFSKNANFILKGGHDSTQSDILVNNKFYIEIKQPKAQCGQFVLFPENSTKKFIYSEKNKTEKNEWSSKIIKYMDDNFEKFENPTSKGVKIEIDDQDIFYNWIINYYTQKNSKLFITGDCNNFIIFPTIEFRNYFDVSATYRIKNSGSHSVGVNSIQEVSSYITEKYKGKNPKLESDNEKLFVITDPKFDLNKHTFYIDETKYMFSKRNDKFEIRKLSKTKNANVIFSIKLKENVQGLTDPDIINYLNP